MHLMASEFRKSECWKFNVTFRFQKRTRILPGLRLNVSKTGISWTLVYLVRISSIWIMTMFFKIQLA